MDRAKLAPASGLTRGAYVLSEAANSKPEPPSWPPALRFPWPWTPRPSWPRTAPLSAWSPCHVGKALGPKRRVPRPGPAFGPTRVSIEAGISQGWHRFIGENGVAIAIDRFGASAPGGVNMTKFGFTADNVCSKVLGLLGKA